MGRPVASGRACGLGLPSRPVRVSQWNHMIKPAFFERAVGSWS